MPDVNYDKVFSTEPISTPSATNFPGQKRRELLDKIFLGNFLFGPEAMRSYATIGGTAVGGFLGAGAGGVGAVPGSLFGGYVGNRLMNEAQSWAPEVLGEPAENGITTALTDVALDLGGKGFAKALPKIIQHGKKVLTPEGRNEILARMVRMGGILPEEQITTHALDPEYITNMRAVVDDLQKAQFPMTGGQVQGAALPLEFERTAKTHPGMVVAQGKHIQEQAKTLLNQGNILKQITPDEMFKIGRGRTAEWVDKTSPSLRQYIGKGTDMEKWLNGAVGNLEDFKTLIMLTSPEKANTVLFKKAMESSLNADGVFDPIPLYGFFRKNRDQFEHVASLLEKQGKVKASDLKASWNRFIYSNLMAARGKSVSNKVLEIQATQAGITGAISIPILGMGSYPAVRALATGMKVALVGPALGKAFSDPKVVEQLTRLSTMPANSPAAKNSVRELAKWAWKNGVRFTTMNGNQISLNPSTLQPETPTDVSPKEMDYNKVFY